ncbi:MAG: FG-GAP repeat protein, partial [Deltaproteobacteria bacterium]|nr:FG-GAP repeat protein [Deltaproteobacteria bacterium]
TVEVTRAAALAQAAYVKASNTEALDYFGLSVAVSGDTLVVGATREDSGATGVGGVQADNAATESGAVYVLTRIAGVSTCSADELASRNRSVAVRAVSARSRSLAARRRRNVGGTCRAGRATVVAMHRLVVLALLTIVATSCDKKQTASDRATREQCIAVRDHVVELILQHYMANGPETFDGLDRSDTATMVGIPPGVKRETFALFLASEAGKPWLANTRARLVAGTGLTDTVEKCVQRGTPTHIACWRGASSMEIFQRCPTP